MGAIIGPVGRGHGAPHVRVGAMTHRPDNDRPQFRLVCRIQFHLQCPPPQPCQPHTDWSAGSDSQKLVSHRLGLKHTQPHSDLSAEFWITPPCDTTAPRDSTTTESSAGFRFTAPRAPAPVTRPTRSTAPVHPTPPCPPHQSTTSATPPARAHVGHPPARTRPRHPLLCILRGSGEGE